MDCDIEMLEYWVDRELLEYSEAVDEFETHEDSAFYGVDESIDS